MRSPWPRVRIANLCERIVDCLNRTAPVVDYDTDFKMIRTTNVRDGWIDLSDVRCVNEPTFTKWTRRELPSRGDIVLTREAPLGEVGMIRTLDRVFLGQRTVLYRADPSKLDNRYLLYALQGAELQQQIRAFGSGSTVEHMRVPDAKELVVALPDLETQSRIGAILGGLDDLIENNTRRIAILEEMARCLFEEWFVHFRAPGCASLPMIDSPLGLIPMGWEAATVGDITSYVNRGIPPDYAEDGPSLVINQKCIRGQRLSLDPARRQQKAIPREKVVRPFDVLINSTGVGTLGRVAQVIEIQGDYTVDSHVTIARPDGTTDPVFFGMTMLKLESELEALGVGSTGQTELQRERIRAQKVLRPSPAAQRRFGEFVRPMRKLGHLLDKQNANLRAQRDLLLPKLISGEIDLSVAVSPQQKAAE